MFVPFLYHCRAHGLAVTTTEWMALMEALAMGLAQGSLHGFYSVSRSLLVHREADFDKFDHAFGTFFKGVEEHFDISEELLDWLSNPKLPGEITDEMREAMSVWDLDRLREEFEARMKEQTERHDGGNRWIGTGGTSPFGHGGTNPQGIRVGGTSGGRSAVQVALDRRYKNLRNDVVLDTRQVGAALRRLRKLGQEGRLDTLDIDQTIDQTARDAGEISLVFGPPRENNVRLLLLMDVGGSMDPYAERSERLFSAAHAHSHFKEFKHYYFHNCIYDRLYTDFEQMKSVQTDDVLRTLDHRWAVVIVGDAYMHPFELMQVGGIINYRELNERTGWWWLQQVRDRCQRSVWLNPEPQRLWGAPTISRISSLFPMYPFTLDGLTEAVDVLRGAKRPAPTVGK